MEWDGRDGRRRLHSFDEELTETDARHRLRTAISGRGEWLPAVLREAHTRLTELRAEDPTAGGIVFADNVAAAEEIGQLLRNQGTTAVVATSDKVEAASLIKEFGVSTEPWIVTVRMVSEGVDIPRLRLGVYATAWQAELFFRQVVGRMVRVRKDEEGQAAYLYIPDDPRLRAMAQQIRDTREHSLNQRDEELLGGRDNSTSTGAMPLALFTPISTGAPEDRGVIAEDTVLSPEELAAAESLKQLSERTRNLGTEQVAILLRNMAQHGMVVTPQNVPATAQVAAPRPMQADRKADLRAANNQIAARISKAHGIDHKTVNGRLNAAVGIPKLRQATEEQLENRLRFAHHWLAGEAQPVAGS